MASHTQHNASVDNTQCYGWQGVRAIRPKVQQLLVLCGNKAALTGVVTLNVPVPPPHDFFPAFLSSTRRGREPGSPREEAQA